jgi:hypothetical protein
MPNNDVSPVDIGTDAASQLRIIETDNAHSTLALKRRKAFRSSVHDHLGCDGRFTQESTGCLGSFGVIAVIPFERQQRKGGLASDEKFNRLFCFDIWVRPVPSSGKVGRPRGVFSFPRRATVTTLLCWCIRRFEGGYHQSSLTRRVSGNDRARTAVRPTDTESLVCMTRLILKAIDVGASAVFVAFCTKTFCVYLFKQPSARPVQSASDRPRQP